MSVFPLLLALRQDLTAAMRTMWLAGLEKVPGTEPPEAPDVTPPIYIGQLPPRTRPEAGPFVLLQPLSGVQDEDSFHLVDVAIRVCVFNSGLEAAENDLSNLLELIRRELMPCRQQALGDRYVLTASDRGLLPWTRPDDQAQPYLEAYIISTWKLWGYE